MGGFAGSSGDSSAWKTSRAGLPVVNAAPMIRNVQTAAWSASDTSNDAGHAARARDSAYDG
jgi:hypothetical protein